MSIQVYIYSPLRGVYRCKGFIKGGVCSGGLRPDLETELLATEAI